MSTFSLSWVYVVSCLFGTLVFRDPRLNMFFSGDFSFFLLTPGRSTEFSGGTQLEVAPPWTIWQSLMLGLLEVPCPFLSFSSVSFLTIWLSGASLPQIVLDFKRDFQLHWIDLLANSTFSRIIDFFFAMYSARISKVSMMESSFELTKLEGLGKWILSESISWSTLDGIQSSV